MKSSIERFEEKYVPVTQGLKLKQFFNQADLGDEAKLQDKLDKKDEIIASKNATIAELRAEKQALAQELRDIKKAIRQAAKAK